MGMSAQILALGRFDEAIVPHLVHPPERYAQVPPGTWLLEPVMPPTPGSSTGHALAEAVGAAAWDFETHALDVSRFDWDALRSALDQWLPASMVEAILVRIQALAHAGFRFWFRPNG
jgi:hypothetical protein